MSNYLVLVNDINILDEIKELGYTNFLFALKDYSIGYNCFTYEEISQLSGNKYLLINRILDSKDIRLLEQIITNLNDIKGIIFEDLGIFEIAKKHHLNIELIYFHNHAGTNYETINFWLNEGIDSVVISNEITKEEIIEIVNNAIKPLVLTVFGHNQIMYSRRTLLTNYHHFHQLDNNKLMNLNTASKHFIACESEYGTVFYTKSIYNYFELKDLSYKYLLINLVLLNNEESLKVLNDIKNSEYNFSYLETSNGFLDQKTIFKLGGKNNG